MVKYYSCCEDNERLINTSSADAVHDFIDDQCAAGESLEDSMQRLCPVTVYEFENETITEHDADLRAARFLESIDEEYGDPEEEFEVINAQDQKALHAVVRAICANATVWLCKQIGKEAWSIEQCRKVCTDD